MTAMESAATPSSLRLAVVLSTTEDLCSVFADGQRMEVRYAIPFPTPRMERVSPGHLVALAATTDGGQAVLWRWYDAVVLTRESGQVRLWEPGHGEVLATARDAKILYSPGSRAYVSAGLPGAEWWVAGPAVGRAEDANVDLAEVERF